MPKIPIDYSKCCIYKIEHIENESIVYVGHTTNFDKRKGDHKNNSKNDTGKAFNLKLYQMIRKNGDWDDFKMFEVEKYPCNDRREAEKRENEVMKELKANMNTIQSFRTKEDTLEQYRKYYHNNKEDRLEQYRKYYQNNKDKKNEENKEYYEKNKQHILIKHKEKITCECGCEITKLFFKKHQTSKKHMDFINKIQ